MHYKWQKTGNGTADNLGVQLEKTLRRSARTGSIRTRRDRFASGRRFVIFVAENFQAKKIQNLQQKHLDAYVKYLQISGRSNGHIKNELSRIRWVYDQIADLKNPLPEDAKRHNRELQIGKTPDGRADRAWQGHEVDGMRNEAIKTNRQDVVDTIDLQITTGMRIEEALTLRRHNAEKALRNGKLELTNTKGGRPRSVKLTTEARAILERLKNSVNRGEYLIREGEDRHRVIASVIKWHYRHRHKIQDQDRNRPQRVDDDRERGALTSHGLRHARAREYRQERLDRHLAAGHDRDQAERLADRETAEMLGHGRESVTQIYL